MGTADWDRERLNMSVNTPASWPAYALRTRLVMPFGPAALRGLTRLNVLLTPAMENESPQSLVACHYSPVCSENVGYVFITPECPLFQRCNMC